MPYRSSTAQTLLNYLDPSDIRARHRPTSLIGQVFNAAAAGLDPLRRTVELEVAGQSLQGAINLDNQGVWYSASVPNSYPLNLDSNGNVQFGAIAVQKSNAWYGAIPFDELNPVPSGATIDPSRSVVYLGAGGSSNQLLQTAGSGAVQIFPISTSLILSNSLSFQVLGMSAASTEVSIEIQGYLEVTHPILPMRQLVVETLNITQDGLTTTENSWSQVIQIRVTGLDPAATLTATTLPFNPTFVPDPANVYVDPLDRNIDWALYWSLSEGFPAAYIKRNVVLDYERVWRYGSGLSYRTAPSITQASDALAQQISNDGVTITLGNAYTVLPSITASDLAPEPNTNGLLLSSGSILYWMDRRQPWPGSLVPTGLTVSPAYTLHCGPDPTWTGFAPAVVLSATAAARAANVQRWRYTAKDPAGNQWAVAPEGGQIILSSSAGWRTGTVLDARFVLDLLGDYVFTLEMFESGTVGYSADAVPWSNAAPKAQSAINISSITSLIDGLCFDTHARLWVRSGDFAIPIQLTYDAYSYDASSSNLFFTQPYSQIVLP